MNKQVIATVYILLIIDIVCLLAMFAAFHWSFPPEVKTTMLTVFSGWNGALALALHAGGTPPTVNP